MEDSPNQSRGVGFLLIGLGLVVMIAIAPLTGLILAAGVHVLLGTIVWIGLAAAGRAIYKVGRKHTARSAGEVLAKDQRPPVVYLRSFAADETAAETVGTGVAMFGVDLSTPRTEEQQLAICLRRVGPVIAIGKPGEYLPELGVARMYVSHTEWQEKVMGLLQTAKLVVLRPGVTEGFWWEVQNVARVVRPERIVFILPYDAAEYETFRQRAAPFLPVPLPAAEDHWASWSNVGSIRAVLWFSPDWTPHLAPIGFGTAVASGFGGDPVAAVLNQSLAPVFRQIGEDHAAATFPVGRRLIAAVIDQSILGVPAALAIPLFSTAFGENGVLLLCPFLFFWVICYFALLDGGDSPGTLGKRWLGIEARSSTGDVLSLPHSFGRAVAKAATLVILPITFLANLIILLHTTEKRLLHDRLAGTCVIRKL